MKPLPNIGDTVHFVHGDTHVPAICTEVEHYAVGEDTSDGQSLIVFPSGEAPFTTVASQRAAYAPAT